MMITKDELELLERRPEANKELHYTIGGTVEAAVHSNLEAERTSKLINGHRAMSAAVKTFRNNMAFKAREGLAQSQFQNSAPDIPKDIPPQDLPLAQNTWRENHIEAHRQALDAASHNLRSSLSAASGDKYLDAASQDMTPGRVQHSKLER